MNCYSYSICVLLFFYRTEGFAPSWVRGSFRVAVAACSTWEKSQETALSYCRNKHTSAQMLHICDPDHNSVRSIRLRANDWSRDI